MATNNFPTEVLSCGGLIERVANHTLMIAHRPNKILAYMGAISWVSHCMGRRFRTETNGRPNLFIVATGWSGVGKSAPRRTIQDLARECNMTDTVIEDFRSGEGLEDCLLTNARVLSLTDEIENLFNTIKVARDGTGVSMMDTMLKLWEKSGSYMTRRQMSNARASKKDDNTPRCAFHPHFSMFGTGVTSEVYKSISAKMASNGLFARLLFVDAGKRGPKGIPIYRSMDDSIITESKRLAGWVENFKEWAANNPASNDTGVCVFETEAARKFRAEFEAQADAHYNDEEDGAANAVWNRTAEKAEKLAMTFAASENPDTMRIDLHHWEMAAALVTYSNKLQLSLLDRFAADTEYQDLQNRVLRMVGKGVIPARKMLMSLHVKSADLEEVTETLVEAGRLMFCDADGKTLTEYKRGVCFKAV